MHAAEFSRRERLGTTFQQTLIATSVAAENLRQRAALVNVFVRQVRYTGACPANSSLAALPFDSNRSLRAIRRQETAPPRITRLPENKYTVENIRLKPVYFILMSWLQFIAS